MAENAMHVINHYPVDSEVCFPTLIYLLVIYPLDNVNDPLNNWDQCVKNEYV